MQRKDWKFSYNIDTLLKGATAKRDLHEGKLKWWEGKKKETIAKVKDVGIEVQDSVAASYSSTKGNYGPQVVIDATLQRDLSECQQKIREHDLRVRTFNGWIAVLTQAAADPSVEYYLDHEDYLFFFGDATTSSGDAD